MGYKNTVAQGGDATANSSGLANSLIISANPCMLHSCVVFNTGPDQYFQLHDSAALPAEGAVPRQVIKVPTDSYGYFDVALGRPFTLGAVVCNSTTAATKTLGLVNALLDGTFRRKT